MRMYTATGEASLKRRTPARTPSVKMEVSDTLFFFPALTLAAPRTPALPYIRLKAVADLDLGP